MTDNGAIQRSAALLDLGRADEALHLLAPLVASGNDPVAHTLAVAALLAAGRPQDAVGVAGAALNAFGPLPELARVASYAYRGVGALEESLAAARAGVAQAPHWVPGLLALIEAETALRHRSEAEAALTVALAQAPEDPVVRLVAADVAWAWGEHKQTRQHCQAALRLDPTNVAALRGLGLVDERSNRIGRAARWYARALQLRPGDPELAGRVRALFGRLLGSVTLGLLVASFVVFIAFMAQADPAPGRTGSAVLPELVFWILWIAGFAGLFAVLLWSSVRGVPRLVLAALRSETRTYRRVRRCAVLTLAYAASVFLTVLAALAPLGTAADRLGVVLLIWLISMGLMIAVLVSLRLTFGHGGMRAAKAHPRDASFAG